MIGEIINGKSIKIKEIIFLIISILLVINGFLSFCSRKKYYSSVEEAYNNVYRQNPLLISEGYKTALVIGENDVVFALKEDKGWYFPNNQNIQTSSIFQNSDISIGIIEYKHSKEYFIVVMLLNDEKTAVIEDSLNSIFKSCVRETGVERNIITVLMLPVLTN